MLSEQIKKIKKNNIGKRFLKITNFSHVRRPDKERCSGRAPKAAGYLGGRLIVALSTVRTLERCLFSEFSFRNDSF